MISLKCAQRNSLKIAVHEFILLNENMYVALNS